MESIESPCSLSVSADTHSALMTGSHSSTLVSGCSENITTIRCGSEEHLREGKRIDIVCIIQWVIIHKWQGRPPREVRRKFQGGGIAPPPLNLPPTTIAFWSWNMCIILTLIMTKIFLCNKDYVYELNMSSRSSNFECSCATFQAFILLSTIVRSNFRTIAFSIKN